MSKLPPSDDEEDFTVVDPATSAENSVLENKPSSDSEDDPEGTVAFVKKSDLSDRPLHRTTLEEIGPLPSFSQYVERFPLQAALPKQRFAAFLIDSLIILYLLFVAAFTSKQLLFSANTWNSHAELIVKAMAFFIFFAYYLLFESLSSTSPGKWFCRLKIVDMEGFAPKLASIFLRNLCRLFDYPFAFLVALLSMESSPFNQRLGDRAAQTVVIYNPSSSPLIDLRSAPLSSTYIRMLSFCFDLSFYFLLLYLCLGAINPENNYSSLGFGLLLSFISWGYFTLFEIFTETTPGKFILGRRVILSNGQSLDTASAVIRNLFLPFDVLLAYLLIALSSRKQRLGDLMADTLVIKKAGHRKGRIGFVVLILMIIFLTAANAKNPQKNWWMNTAKNYFIYFSEKLHFKAQLLSLAASPETPAQNKAQINAAQATSNPLSSGNVTTNTSVITNLNIPEFYISSGPNPSQIRNDATFSPGEEVFLFFRFKGFARGANQNVFISQAAKVLNPEGTVYLQEAKVTEFNQTLDNAIDTLAFANSFKLKKELAPGSYKILLEFKDNVSGQVLNYEKGFRVEGL